MPASGRWPIASSDEDFADHLRGAAPDVAAMFWRFINMARACGPVTFELQRSLVILRGSSRIFASVQAKPHGLRGHLNLARQLPADSRIRKSEPLTKNLHFHRFALSSPRDLDEQFAQLLCEARNVGDDQV